MDDELIEKFLAEHGDADGNVSDEVMARFLNGDISVTPAEGKTGDTEQGEQSAAPASGQAPEPAASPGEEEGQAGKEPDPVVLAKDGKHPIPFAELEKTRDEARKAKELVAKLQADLQAQADIIKQMEAASKQDEGSGDTKAMDDLIADLSDDYPGAAKLILELRQTVETLTAERKQEKTVLAEQDAATKAQIDFDKEVSALQPKYQEVIGFQKFWDWFGAQSALVQSAKNSGNPQVVADVITMYLDSAGKTASAGDTAQSKPESKVDVAKAISAAKEKNPVVRSLSDVPGGSNPATDELSAIEGMSPMDMANKFMTMDPSKINQILNRML